MNERIRELAENATLYTSDVCYPDDPDWHEIRDQKFAELLIRECALQCHHNDDMDRIEKHFGVE